jgi:hypothetical protein
VFPGGKTVGAWNSAPIASNAEVKEREELYHFSRFAFMESYSVIFTFILFFKIREWNF